MTKSRRRTHKIHRKRRGFKSRSQRGGWPWDSEPTNQTGTNTKEQSWSDWIMGKPSYTPLDQTQTKVNNPMQQDSTQTYIAQQQPPVQPPVQTQNLSTYAGGRKRCKRHHKHSRRCKK